MAFYRLDRFARTLATKEAAMTMTSFVLPSLIQKIPAKTPEQQAQEDLDRLLAQQTEAERAAAVAAAEDIGAPPRPWLLYAGIGVGAVALIGGALLLTKKKGKVAGYRKRRRSRRRRR
jgi:hypothetical protein